MSRIGSYLDLEVWHFAKQWAKGIYAITREFPSEELYGLTSQIRWASVSIPTNIAKGSNIAEGYGRDNSGDYARFLRITQSSPKKLEQLLPLSCDIVVATHPVIEAPMAWSDRIGRMLYS